MKKSTIAACALLMALLMTLFTVGCTTSAPGQAAPTNAPEEATQAMPEQTAGEAAQEEPAEAAPEAQENADGYVGPTFSSDDLSGNALDEGYIQGNQLTMVNFWATWCGPCVNELPELAKLHENYAEKGVGVLGVLMDPDNPDGARSVMDKSGVTYPVVPLDAAWNDLAEGIYAIPTTMFFDAAGNQVGETVVGSNDYDGWAAQIDALLEAIG